METGSIVETGPLFWRPVKGGAWHSLPLPKGVEALRPGRSVLLYLGRLGTAPVVGRFKVAPVKAYGTRRHALLPTDAARIAPDLPLPGGGKRKDGSETSPPAGPMGGQRRHHEGD